MVLLSALNGGFLSSLVVMMAPTFSLGSLLLSRASPKLKPTLRALKHACLLIYFQRQRKEDDSSLLCHPL